MKKFLLLSGALAFLTGNLFAGSETIIRERAKELRDQNNVRQGVTPPSQPAAKPAQPTTATAQTAAAAQQTPLARLQADLAAIKLASQVSPEHKQRIANDLVAVAQGAGKPSAASATKLAGDLATALSEKPLSATDRGRLVQNLQAVLNPANIQAAQMQAIFSDVQAIFQAAGVNRNSAVTIAADVKAIAGEVQKGK